MTTDLTVRQLEAALSIRPIIKEMLTFTSDELMQVLKNHTDLSDEEAEGVVSAFLDWAGDTGAGSMVQ